jgi:hypothetical protein
MRSAGFGKGCRRSGLKPASSIKKIRTAFPILRIPKLGIPKTEVLGRLFVV